MESSRKQKILKRLQWYNPSGTSKYQGEILELDRVMFPSNKFNSQNLP